MNSACKSVSLIIPNWNGLRYLQTCLDAVQQQTYPRYEVILVDNGSTDGSCGFVAERYPHVHILRSKTNLGFAGGVNLAIRNTQSDYVATLNNDTQAEPKWLEELVKAMDVDPRIGMCASKMLFYDRRQTINSAGIAVDRAGIAWDRNGGMPDHAEDAEPYEVFGPCAGAALYRRSMLGSIGLFDENYFSYLEDVDLAWRGQANGWRCLYVPLARVYHLHSATGREGSPFKNYLLGRNKWWTIIKNYPTTQLLIHVPAIIAYDLMAIIYNLVARKDVHGLRGRLAAFYALPTVWQKRRYLQTRAAYSPQLAYECLSPIDSPLNIWRRYRHLNKSAVNRASHPLHREQNKI